jgi:hypothetical protein
MCVCAICLDHIDDDDARKLPCGHTYHSMCIRRLRASGLNDGCPECRATLPPGSEESFYQATVTHTRRAAKAKGSLRVTIFAEAEHLYLEALKERIHIMLQHTATSAWS